MCTADASRTNINFKNHNKFRDLTPFVMKKSKWGSTTPQKYPGYNRVTESLMLLVIAGTEMLLISIVNP